MKDSANLTDNERRHFKVSYEAACESMVLLKNDGLLPLTKIGNIALYGAGAKVTLNGGTGSGEVHSSYDVSIKEGLENVGFKVTTNDWLNDYEFVYNEALDNSYKKIARRILRPFTTNMINIIAGAIKFPAGRKITDEDIAKSDTDICVYVIARQSGEASDRLIEDNTLYKEEKEQLEFILNNYKKVIVIINAGSTLEMNWLKDYPNINAIIYYGQPGMEGGNALASTIIGENTPSGKVADTWYYSYSDIPFANEYSYLNDNKDIANYKENVYVGYRYIDSFNKDCMFPFGYGLSYTDFKITFLNVKSYKSIIELNIKVKNIGSVYKGKEVVQIYLDFPNLKIEREKQSLVTFAKTKILLPGEEQILNLQFNLEDFTYYDKEKARFLLEKGIYTIRCGNSSKALINVAYINILEDVITEECCNICPLNIKFDMLHRELTHETFIDYSLPIIELTKDSFEKIVYDYSCKSCLSSKVKDILSDLSFEDKLNIVVGTGLLGTDKVPGAYSTSTKFINKGIASLIMSDGPSGLRIHRRVGISKKNKVVMLEENYNFLKGLPKFIKKLVFANPNKIQYKYQNITAFPAPATLAQSWNIEIANNVGVAIGEEMKEYGITHLLGPAINIHRNPLCGRNFEYFSEDPLLTAKMAIYLTKGVQSNEGCFVTLKHLAVNNQETRRTFMSSNIDERAFRELYLKAFKMIINEANIKSIMTSYNKVNGVYTCNSRDLCIKVLRKEFSFKGIVMTDWLSTGKGLANNGMAIASGNDLIMPGGNKYIKYLKQDYKKGIFTDEDLDNAVSNIIEETLSSNS